ELMEWTSEERAKWLSWLKANPKALDVTVQPGGRFPTVGSLIDHIFLVEHRHTLRLQGKELPTESRVKPGDIEALFAYGARGRDAMRLYLPTLKTEDANKPRDVVVATGTFTLSPRKLLFHMVLHEVRHWAQIASAVRAAGFAPPGDHDLFFSKALI
ncbi:MAG TPA: DinB family protein, partial [Vicinamibacterales bacterium]|nr:DinB family protein [Vicinamibacterales bacterium]